MLSIGKPRTRLTAPRVSLETGVHSPGSGQQYIVAQMQLHMPMELRSGSKIVSFSPGSLLRDEVDKYPEGASPHVSGEQVFSSILDSAYPKIRKMLNRDVSSIRARIRMNLNYFGSEPEYLTRWHRLFGQAGSIKYFPIEKSDLTGAFSGGASSPVNLIRLAFLPDKNDSMIQFMAALLEGNSKEPLTDPNYGKQMNRVTLNKGGGYFKIPVYPNIGIGNGLSLSSTEIPPGMAADVRAYESKTPRRYARKVDTRKKYGDWKFNIMGFGPQTKGKFTPGIYAVSGHGDERKTVLVYYLKHKVSIRPRAWFSSGFSQWARGVGGGNRSLDVAIKDMHQIILQSTVDVLRNNTKVTVPSI